MRALSCSLVVALLICSFSGRPLHAQRRSREPGSPLPVAPANPRLETLKKAAVAEVDARQVLTQQMVDSIFSFSELGFEEVETQRYVTGILAREGFRENDDDRVLEMWKLGDTMANAAAMMTGTTVESRVLGSAWPGHGNRTLAETMQANVVQVGMPAWSDADQQFAKAFQRAMTVPESGLVTTVADTLRGREAMPDDEKMGGPSDDVGDIMWSLPTATLSFPSNIPGATGRTTRRPWM